MNSDRTGRDWPGLIDHFVRLFLIFSLPPCLTFAHQTNGKCLPASFCRPIFCSKIDQSFRLANKRRRKGTTAAEKTTPPFHTPVSARHKKTLLSVPLTFTASPTPATPGTGKKCRRGDKNERRNGVCAVLILFFLRSARSNGRIKPIYPSWSRLRSTCTSQSVGWIVVRLKLFVCVCVCLSSGQGDVSEQTVRILSGDFSSANQTRLLVVVTSGPVMDRRCSTLFALHLAVATVCPSA